MPFAEHDPSSAFWEFRPEQKEPEAPGLVESLGPAFRMENDVAAVGQLMARPRFEPDPNFDLHAELGASPLARDHANDFVGVDSKEEFEYRARKIEEEQRQRELLSSAGGAGVAAMILAGVASPLAFLPIAGPSRGIRGAAEIAALAAGGAVAHEGALQTAQVSRSADESLRSIATETVLAGLLGGAAKFLTRGEFDDMAAGIDVLHGNTTILPSVPGGSSLSAASAAAPSAGRLKSGPFVDTLAQVGPVTRIINDENQIASWMMANAETGGVTLEGNIAGIATARGGSVAARIKTYATGLANALEEFEDQFRAYRLGPTSKAPHSAARIESFFSRNPDKLNFDQFKAEVARAMFSSDKHPVPEVQKAAEAFRRHLYDPILDEAKKVGLIGDDIDLKGAESYLNRLYNIDMMVARPDVVVAKFANHIERKLAREAEEKFLKIKEKRAQSEQDIEDLSRSEEEVTRLRVEIEAELKAMREDPLGALADELSAARRADRAARKEQTKAAQEAASASRESGEPGERAPITAAGEEQRVLGEGGEALQQFLARRSLLNRRMRVLNKTAVALEAKQRRALDQIERFEEQSLAALRRVGRATLALQKKLSKVSDAKLDEEISRLQNQFADLDAVMLRADERLDALEDEFEGALPETRQRRISAKQRDTIVNSISSEFVPTGDVPEGFVRLYHVGEPKGVSQFSTTVPTTDQPVWSIDVPAGSEAARTRSVNPDEFGEPRRVRVSAQVRKAIERAVDDAAAGRKNPLEGTTPKKKTDQAYAAAREAFDKRRQELTEQTLTGRETATGLAERGLAEEGAQERRGIRLSDLAERIEEAATFDRAAAREAIESAHNEILKKISDVNNRRALRIQRSQERVAKLDPARVAEDIEAIKAKQASKEEEFVESIRTKAEDFNLADGKFDFSQHAREIAEEIKDKIIGNDRRIAGLDILVGERGPELARMLDIDEREFSDFLIFDIEHLARAYNRTMSADIEMTRTYGSPNAVDWWRQLRDSFRKEEEALAERLKTEGTDSGFVDKLLTKLGAVRASNVDEVRTATDKLIEGTFASLTPAEREANKKVMDAFQKLWKRQRNIETDLAVVFDRLRHRQGIPENAAGMMYRMGKAALALNTLRLMGSVVLSSVADPARVVMKFGLMNTFHDGFVPMVTNWKAFKMSAQSAKSVGVALDTILASRAASVFDIFDDVGRGTRPERALQFLANNFGNIAGFNQWTSAMKQFTAAVAHANMERNIKLLLTANDLTSKKVAKATEMLASLGIDDTNIRAIWEQLQLHGDEVGGTRWPNLEDWTDKDAKRAYQAALAQVIDDTIITPGAERPNWVDHNIGFRLVAQFRSFALSSTTKMMIAGLQQRDLAVVNGMIISLALGALSYYLWAVSVGGEASEDMLKAGPDKWADEAIERSGLLAVFGEVRYIGERIPLTRNLVTLSGERTTRRQGSNLIEAITGPSFGLADSLSSIALGVDDPTQSTLHQFRNILPFQNVFYTRLLLDKIEKGVAESINLPESRQ